MQFPPVQDNISNSPVTVSWNNWFTMLTNMVTFLTPLVRSDSGDSDTNLSNVRQWPGDLTIQYNTTLTANRTITLPSAMPSGSIVRVTRPATGAHNLSVNGVKTLTAGEWCMLQSNGNSWIEIAFGNL